ncbi:MAG: hypothetical protein K2Q10_09770 [Rhodospirillales bacterium]|nr:hypothetical protein [Rhodospirillales bacterium]
MTRVATLATQEAFIRQMNQLQGRVNNAQEQLSTELKSQNYAGISTDAYRLINLQTQRERLDRYNTDNQVAEIRLKTQGNVMDSIGQTLRDFKKKLATASTDVDTTNGVSPEEQTRLTDLQDSAFNGMKTLETLLNTQVDGQYLFAGGRINTRPVALTDTSGNQLNSLAQFQAVYDGVAQTYPTTRATSMDPAQASAWHKPYYRGDQLQIEHRVDEDRTITLGINATDGAFEKAFRGLGILAQGDLSNPANASRLQEALDLVSDALEHDSDPNGPTASENASDLEKLVNRIGNNRVVLSDQKSRNDDAIAYLDTQIITYQNVDKVEVVTRLNSDLQNLQMSFAALSKVLKTSLADYI